MADTYILELVDDAGNPTGNKINLLVEQICLVEAITSNTSGQADVTLTGGSVFTVVTPKDGNGIHQVSLIGNGFKATLPSGGNCWISGIAAVIPADEALKVKGPKPISGTTRIYGTGFSYIDVTESLITILNFLGVPPGLPLPPTNLTAVLNADGTATLAWVLPTIDVNGNPLALSEIGVVYVSNNGGNVSGELQATTFTTPPLATGTYHFSVHVTDSVGSSLPSNISITNTVGSPPGIPMPPVSLSGGYNTNTNTLDLTWQLPATDVNGVFIPASAFTSVTIFDNNGLIGTLPGSATSCSISTIPPTQNAVLVFLTDAAGTSTPANLLA